METPSRYSKETEKRARDLILNEDIGPIAEQPGSYDCIGSTGRVYRQKVLLLADGTHFVTCSCPNGVKKGGEPSCFHSLAALIMETGGDSLR